MNKKSKKVSAADLLKNQLSNVVTSDKRGGEAVAKKALEKSPKKKKAKVEKEVPITKPHNSRLEKITISLHGEDLDRLDKIEEALRKEKVPGRVISTSTLIKIAIAGFEGDSEKLMGLFEKVKGQDRRKKG